eukprot:TRINITY_DN3283_c0_g1_i1.p1 TRINITY_DN3283_c0_g1~~TRINITY_DN3283_c0_g1_i1.p1  ORF type:complete len:565 (-),score=63.20 TRINITY_DN3283_c0_g1_i1:2-1696(-)
MPQMLTKVVTWFCFSSCLVAEPFAASSDDSREVEFSFETRQEDVSSDNSKAATVQRDVVFNDHAAVQDPSSVFALARSSIVFAVGLLVTYFIYTALRSESLRDEAVRDVSDEEDEVVAKGRRKLERRRATEIRTGAMPSREERVRRHVQTKGEDVVLKSMLLDIKEQRLEEADIALQKIERQTLRERIQCRPCYCALIDAYVSAGQLVKAERWLNLFVRTSNGNDFCECAHQLIEAHVLKSSIQKAEGLSLRVAKEVKLEKRTYLLMIETFKQHGDKAKELEWMERTYAAGFKEHVVDVMYADVSHKEAHTSSQDALKTKSTIPLQEQIPDDSSATPLDTHIPEVNSTSPLGEHVQEQDQECTIAKEGGRGIRNEEEASAMMPPETQESDDMHKGSTDFANFDKGASRTTPSVTLPAWRPSLDYEASDTNGKDRGAQKYSADVSSGTWHDHNRKYSADVFFGTWHDHNRKYSADVFTGTWHDHNHKQFRVRSTGKQQWEASARYRSFTIWYDKANGIYWWGVQNAYFADASEVQRRSDKIVWYVGGPQWRQWKQAYTWRRCDSV